ncbi:hypothetical protein [Mesorhizobium sp. M0500]|uniref:hypothetical protein n=1 Tax=Mesorhizobium sp. M0500 TaxID=2956953 RepID=UPI0033384911
MLAGAFAAPRRPRLWLGLGAAVTTAVDFCASARVRDGMGTLDALKKQLEAVETEIVNLGGGSDQLKAALKELSDITERAGGAFNNSATSAANFKTVLADLKNLVPELKANSMSSASSTRSTPPLKRQSATPLPCRR